MTDDFHDPNNPCQDCHSVEIAEAENHERPGRPPTSRNVKLRFPEIITDPGCNQLSASRFAFLLICVLGSISGVIMTLTSRDATGLFIGLATSSAGIYAASKFGNQCGGGQ